MGYNKKELEKGMTSMEIANVLQKKDDELLAEMDAYISKLKARPQPEAKESAVKELKRTGVLSTKGNSKKKIVSWE